MPAGTSVGVRVHSHSYVKRVSLGNLTIIEIKNKYTSYEKVITALWYLSEKRPLFMDRNIPTDKIKEKAVWRSVF